MLIALNISLQVSVAIRDAIRKVNSIVIVWKSIGEGESVVSLRGASLRAAYLSCLSVVVILVVRDAVACSKPLP